MATTANRKAAAKAAGAYNVQALPTSNVQYRHASGGTGTVQAAQYMQATRALQGWARSTGNPANTMLVHALVHLGWCSGTGARSTVRMANSAAAKHAAPWLQPHIGGPANAALVACLQALAAAGAPNAAMATVWATVTGQAAKA